MPDDSEKKFANAFSLTGKIGPRGFAKLREYFASFAEAWRAGAGELVRAGFSESDTEEIACAKNRIDPDAAWRELLERGTTVTASDEASYPPLLATISDAPFMLYAEGVLPAADEKLIAVVGTRRPTAYGKEAARFLAQELARAGFSVVSGLAEGIDAIAHETALAEGVKTYAVLGSGLDDIYPPTNRRLAERIAEHGALISEFPLGAPPLKHHFPQRNRVISGLSMGTLVIEAREKSGALITGEFALEQGREVFAVPGPIFSASSRGTNRLIQQGAKAAMDINDILMEFGFEAVGSIGSASYAPTSPEERAVLEFLREEPKHLDAIIRETALRTSDVHTTLTLLEINGVIQHLGGNIYTIKR